MNGAQIERALRQDKFASQSFVGVFAADRLPVKEFPGSYVVNTDETGQPGQHWVAFYTVDDTIECFDSFGKDPGVYNAHIKKWLDDTYKVIQCETIQSDDTTVCGQHCLFFILLRSYKLSYEDVMSAYTENTEFNDRLVCKFINKFCRLNTTVRDKYFLLSQLKRK